MTKMFIVFATIIVVTAAVPDRSAEKLIVSRNSNGKNSSSICKTPICFKTASAILKKMDRNVNPCHNFYQFACGKFIEETVIPDNKWEVTTYSLIQRKLKDQLLLSLSDEIRKDDLPVFQSIKSFYQTCMNTENIVKNTENELKEILKKLGGWPILDGLSWNQANFNWEKFVMKSVQKGYDIHFFLGIYVDVDFDNTSKYIIKIDHPLLITTPKNLPANDENDQLLKAYVHFISQVVSFLGGNFEESREDILNLIKFEQKLLNISHHIRNNKRMTVTDLEVKYPNVSWLECLNGFLAPHAHVDRNEEVLVHSTDFLGAFSALIATTPKRVLANYGMWRIIRQSIVKSEGRLRDASTDFSAIMNGKRIQVPRQEGCYDSVNKFFPTAVASLYVRNYFDKNSKTKVDNLVRNIRASLHDMIKQADWLDSVTKKRALEKLASMGEYIGYPDELLDDEKLNEYYKNVTVHSENYLEFQLSLNKFRREQRLSNLRKTINDVKWIEHSESHKTNAVYNFGLNLIDIQAGILQEELFHVAKPNYMNYGAIGWVVGHEMSHAFDSQGSQFDKDGNVANWWESETKEIYSQRVNCIVEQYNNYTVKDINKPINGHQSQGENIADNSGLKAAYDAYNNLAEKNNLEPQLPGLDYTPQQMFWISAASWRCEKVDSKALERIVRDDEHPPKEFRVIGSMSNMPEFSKDFHCPAGSPMNPKKKCAVW